MPELLLLLKTIPFRDWCYVALIAALLTALVWFGAHERSVEHAKDTQAQQRIDAAAVIHNGEVEKRAGTLAQQMAASYHAALSSAPAAAPILMCHAAAPLVRYVYQGQGSAPAGPASHAPPASGAENTPTFDPSPAVIKDGAEANAQIAYLQNYITTILRALQ